jgi:uncharacterized protein
MTIYCDTSFLVPLYLEGDSFTAAATRLAASFDEPIPYPWLVELELINTLHRSVGLNLIDRTTCQKLTRQIQQDKIDGILVPSAVNQARHRRKALELSQQYVAVYLNKSLDVLHVAAALELRAHGFASFDIRQRKLAGAAGLELLPRTVPASKA